ncbi:MAG: hypothetical protein ACYC5F_00500 [Thermoleophilia bacterium]
MEYKQLEDAIRAEAATISREGRDWTASEVAQRLLRLAEDIAMIQQQRSGGIDASMGKRSGGKLEI